MAKRRTVYNPKTPWGLYFHESDLGLPTDWTRVDIDLTAVATGAAHLSDQYDITSKYGHVSDWWRWRASFQFQSATIVGELVKLYICGADDTDSSIIDGGFGASATDTVTEADLANCDNFGNVDTTQTDSCIQSGLVRIMDRYISLAVHNATAGELTSPAEGDSWLKMWPVTKIVLP